MPSPRHHIAINDTRRSYGSWTFLSPVLSLRMHFAATIMDHLQCHFVSLWLKELAMKCIVSPAARSRHWSTPPCAWTYSQGLCWSCPASFYEDHHHHHHCCCCYHPIYSLYLCYSSCSYLLLNSSREHSSSLKADLLISDPWFFSFDKNLLRLECRGNLIFRPHHEGQTG